MQKQILIVEDEPAIADMVAFALTRAGIEPVLAADTRAAQEAIVARVPDLILLDWMLPGVSGIDFARRLKRDELTREVPIIMLTARGAELDIVRGLQIGADDYVTKPFRIGELVARMQAVLRRAEGPQPGEPALIQTGRLRIDLGRRAVRLGEAPIALTPTEYGMLAFLARHLGQVMNHEQILRAVWGDSYGGESHYLWVHVGHLRQKLEHDAKQPRYILTERGVGYRLAKLEAKLEAPTIS